MNTIIHAIFIYVFITTIPGIFTYEHYNPSIFNSDINTRTECNLWKLFSAFKYTKDCQTTLRTSPATEPPLPKFNSASKDLYLCAGIFDTVYRICNLYSNPNANIAIPSNKTEIEANITNFHNSVKDMQSFCNSTKEVLTNVHYISAMNKNKVLPNIVELNSQLDKNCLMVCGDWTSLPLNPLCSVLLWMNNFLIGTEIYGKIPIEQTNFQGVIPPENGVAQTSLGNANELTQPRVLSDKNGKTTTTVSSSSNSMQHEISSGSQPADFAVKLTNSNSKQNHQQQNSESEQNHHQQNSQAEQIDSQPNSQAEQNDPQQNSQAEQNHPPQNNHSEQNSRTDASPQSTAVHAQNAQTPARESDAKSMSSALNSAANLGAYESLDEVTNESLRPNVMNTDADQQDEELLSRDDEDHEQMERNDMRDPLVNKGLPVANASQTDKDDEFLEQSEPELDSDKKDQSNSAHSGPPDPPQHLVTYFMVVSFMCLMCYIGYHKKHMIMAILFEGRKSRGGRSRRRPNTASYRKLDCTLEEAVTSQCNSNVTHVIY